MKSQASISKLPLDEPVRRYFGWIFPLPRFPLLGFPLRGFSIVAVMA
jgi:hypothetical protein